MTKTKEVSQPSSVITSLSLTYLRRTKKKRKTGTALPGAPPPSFFPTFDTSRRFLALTLSRGAGRRATPKTADTQAQWQRRHQANHTRFRVLWRDILCSPRDSATKVVMAFGPPYRHFWHYHHSRFPHRWETLSSLPTNHATRPKRKNQENPAVLWAAPKKHDDYRIIARTRQATKPRKKRPCRRLAASTTTGYDTQPDSFAQYQDQNMPNVAGGNDDPWVRYPHPVAS